MSFTLVAFAEQRADSTAGYINAATDETHRTSGDDLYIGKWNLLVAGYSNGYSPQTSKLVSPSLRAMAEVYISPQYIPGAPQAFDRMVDHRFHCPIPLVTGEALNFYQEVNGYNASRVELLGVWLADAPIVPVVGEIYTVQINSYEATDFVKGVWKNHELTITPDLPMGRYAIVGAQMYGADYGLFRFVFRGVAERPGAVVFQDERLAIDEIFREGRIGVWGEFDSSLQPSMDVLFVSTNSSTQLWGYMDIMKVG